MEKHVKSYNISKIFGTKSSVHAETMNNKEPTNCGLQTLYNIET